MGTISVELPGGTEVTQEIEVDVSGMEVEVEIEENDALEMLQYAWGDSGIAEELDDDAMWGVLQGRDFDPPLSDEQLIAKIKAKPALFKLAFAEIGLAEEEKPTLVSRAKELLKRYNDPEGKKELKAALKLLVGKGRFRSVMHDVLGRFYARKSAKGQLQAKAAIGEPQPAFEPRAEAPAPAVVEAV